MTIRDYSCCNPVYWRHDDGVDVYRGDECELVIAADVHNKNPRLRVFPINPGVNTLVEDALTLADARRHVTQLHATVAGFRICLAPRRIALQERPSDYS
jgi:hypothetical protein